MQDAQRGVARLAASRNAASRRASSASDPGRSQRSDAGVRVRSAASASGRDGFARRRQREASQLRRSAWGADDRDGRFSPSGSRTGHPRWTARCALGCVSQQAVSAHQPSDHCCSGRRRSAASSSIRSSSKQADRLSARAIGPGRTVFARGEPVGPVLERVGGQVELVAQTLQVDAEVGPMTGNVGRGEGLA